jgi:LysM repeat protein
VTVKSISNTPTADNLAKTFYSDTLHPKADFILSAGQGPWQVAENLMAQGYYPELSVLDLNDLIVQWNGSGSAVYRAGARIKVAPPAPYTLKTGDSPWRVAQQLHAQGYFKHRSLADLAADLKPLLPINDWRAGMMLRPATLAPAQNAAPASSPRGEVSTIAANGDSIPPFDYNVPQKIVGDDGRVGADVNQGPWQIAKLLKDAGFYQSLTVDQLYENIKLWNAIGDNDVRPGMRLKVEAPPVYTVPDGKYQWSAAAFYLANGYYQGTPGANITEKTKNLAEQIKTWPSAASWRTGLALEAPRALGFSAGSQTDSMGTHVVTWTATDTGGKAATSSMTAPLYSASSASQKTSSTGDNFSKPEASPSGTFWAYPTVRDQRINWFTWDDHDGLAEKAAGLEFAYKAKFQTWDRIPGMRWSRKNGDWKANEKSWFNDKIDDILKAYPGLEKFNATFGGIAFSPWGQKIARADGGRPDVEGDGAWACESPRWEVEFKPGLLLEGVSKAALGSKLKEIFGVMPDAGTLKLLANMDVKTLAYASIQVSDYYPAAYPGGHQVMGEDGKLRDAKPGDFLRWGLKFEKPGGFKIPKVGTVNFSIKPRFNNKLEFMGLDCQFYFKNIDEYITGGLGNAMGGQAGKFGRKLSKFFNGIPEFTAEAGVNMPVRVYADKAGNWYLRAPFLTGVIRLGGDKLHMAAAALGAAGAKPEVVPGIENEPEADIKDIAYLKIPNIDTDAIVKAMELQGDASLAFDLASDVGGFNPQNAVMARSLPALANINIFGFAPFASAAPLLSKATPYVAIATTYGASAGKLTKMAQGDFSDVNGWEYKHFLDGASPVRTMDQFLRNLNDDGSFKDPKAIYYGYLADFLADNMKNKQLDPFQAYADFADLRDHGLDQTTYEKEANPYMAYTNPAHDGERQWIADNEYFTMNEGPSLPQRGTLHKNLFARPDGRAVLSRYYQAAAAQVIEQTPALKAISVVAETLRAHNVLAANQTITKAQDVADAIDRARVKYGANSNEYRAFLRELANPTVDFGHPDLEAMNRVYYAFVNSDLDVPAQGMKSMGGRYVWTPNAQDNMRKILQGDIAVQHRAPMAQAGVGGVEASPEDQVLASLPAHDEKTLSALEAGEIWQKQPYEAAFTIEQILNQGLATPFDLARQMQNNIPWGNSQTGWPDIVKANDSDAVRAFDLARQTMQIMDQWLSDARKNFNGRSGLLDKTKPVTDQISMMKALIDLKAAYTVAGRVDLFDAHMDSLAKILGPSGASFSNGMIEQAMRRNGYAPQYTDFTRLFYGGNVKAGK